MLPTDNLPTTMHQRLQQQCERWQDRVAAEQQASLAQWLAANPDAAEPLARMWVASDYLMGVALDQPQEFLSWLQAGWYQRALTPAEMAAALDARTGAEELADKEFDRQLRKFRRDMMLRILWRDFCHLAEFAETARDMSHLAEVVIQAAIAYHYRLLQQRFGTPIGKHSGQPQPLVVLGMGKLGGYELNVSSDIDLIFAYPEGGETEGGRKSISNQEFFLKLGQKVIVSIDNTTGDGFVFRVDMRLRPYGESGALVLNFDAMEEYYQTQGRDWERYAMIKARVVSADAIAGGRAAGEELMAMLQPFTYRRYVDFGAIESMRGMKDMINREVQRRGINSDVKLGAGGIREVEFVVQVFQVIRGGRDTRLQERSVLKLLPLLEEEGCLPPGEAARLAEAYILLRNTEHALQGFQDKQTQSLPVDDWGWERLAWLLGFASREDFECQLAAVRAQVNSAFQNVIASKEDGGQKGQDVSVWAELWPSAEQPDSNVDVQHLQQQLASRGVQEAEEVAQIIVGLRSNRTLLAMQPIGLSRLDQLMPRLLAHLCERQEPAETLRRIVVLIEAVSRRTAYFLLLIENPDALGQLVTLCGASSWFADQLARYPSLLDELLDPRRLYNPPGKDELRDELRQQMMRVGWEDTETQMETLRYFRNAHALCVAASEIAEVLPLMKVSDYLTWLAEVVLEHVLTLAWKQMVARHGRPQPDADGREPDFMIVGYGKLGGIELGHGSDLDLVFLYDADPAASSDGERPLDHRTYFTRLGQKIIHILNTQTMSGQLYEVDMRLRPSGNSGLLVSSLAAFARYQREEAWTWEHQALTRARAVAGGERLRPDFEALRAEILQRPRDEQELQKEVVAMREKMRSHLGSKGSAEEKASQFHLKQDAGGIVDIEFMVQYAVLAWSHKAPALTRWTDNIRILETLEAEGLLSAGQVAPLIEAYKAFRSVGHRLALQRLPAVIGGEELSAERAAVQSLWQSLFGDADSASPSPD